MYSWGAGYRPSPDLSTCKPPGDPKGCLWSSLSLLRTGVGPAFYGRWVFAAGMVQREAIATAAQAARCGVSCAAAYRALRPALRWRSGPAIGQPRPCGAPRAQTAEGRACKASKLLSSPTWSVSLSMVVCSAWAPSFACSSLTWTCCRASETCALSFAC